jgi:hypothetical protein
MSRFDSLRMLFRLAAAAVLVTVSGAGPSILPGGSTEQALLGSPAFAAQPRVQNFARLPLCFEANQGQIDAQVQYLARGPGYTVFLTPTEAVLALSVGSTAKRLPLSASPSRHRVKDPPCTSMGKGAGAERAVVRMQLVGSNSYAEASGLDRLSGIANYFLGNDPSKWRKGIPTYGRVQYQDVYPGVSLVYYGNQRQLEYDFVVAPGADPQQIRLRFAGVQSLSVDDAGDLVVKANGQVLRQHQPIVYQEVAGVRRKLKAAFVVQGQDVGFSLGSYDRSQPLIIDPVLSYSTYLGGSGGDFAGSIAVDAAGNIYVAGSTSSPDFPTANPLQAAFAGSLRNAFVAKLTADGSALIYSTYLGGSGQIGSGGDVSQSIAVDSAGNAYVTGTTGSLDFLTIHAFQPIYGGGTNNAFVAKLNADGSALVFSTYLGGSGGDGGRGIAVDAAGNACVTGETSSPDFPTSNPL